MGVNFGYGGYGSYGMMNGVGMMGGMQNAGGSSGNVFLQMKAQYGCDHCYQNGAVPYTYQMNVNPLPQEVTHPSLFRRMFRKFLG